MGPIKYFRDKDKIRKREKKAFFTYIILAGLWMTFYLLLKFFNIEKSFKSYLLIMVSILSIILLFFGLLAVIFYFIPQNKESQEPVIELLPDRLCWNKSGVRSWIPYSKIKSLKKKKDRILIRTYSKWAYIFPIPIYIDTIGNEQELFEILEKKIKK